MRRTASAPAPVPARTAVVVATAVARWAALPVARIGELPASLPAPSFAFLDASTLWSLLPSAVALAALESLLSAAVADGMSVNQRHDPDRELFGQGLANLVAPLFGGVPATAAIARTAVNVRSGATSRLAALTHAAVLALTAVATLALDLVTAVIAGLLLAGVFALRAVSRAARLEEVPLEPGDHRDEERALLAQHIVAYRLDGPLLFAAAHRFLLELTEITPVEVVILRMSRLSAVDATGVVVLRDAVRRLEHRGVTVLVSGMRDEHRRALGTLGLPAFEHTPDAIEHAREHLRERGVLPWARSTDACRGPAGRCGAPPATPRRTRLPRPAGTAG